jgi:hypothetical protein
MRKYVTVYEPLVNNLQSPDSCGRPFHCVGKQGTGEGVLRADLPGREPTATKARQEIGAVEATALGSAGEERLKTKCVTIMRHFHCNSLFPLAEEPSAKGEKKHSCSRQHSVAAGFRHW